MENATRPTTLIYGLRGSSDGVRYVGKTVRTLEYRLAKHLRDARAGSGYRVHHWIRALLSRGEAVHIEVLERVPADASWADAERAWIKKYRDIGIALLNFAEGGLGVTGYQMSPEHRAKISAAMKGRSKSPEATRKRLETMKGRALSPETRAKISAALRKHCENPAAVDRLRAIHLGRKRSAETIARMREGQLRRLRGE